MNFPHRELNPDMVTHPSTAVSLSVTVRRCVLYIVNKSLNTISSHLINNTFHSDGSAQSVPENQLSVDVTASDTGRDYTSRLSMPVIRGGLNSNISDILEASGYGTETDIRVDEDYRLVDQHRVVLVLLLGRFLLHSEGVWRLRGCIIRTALCWIV